MGNCDSPRLIQETKMYAAKITDTMDRFLSKAAEEYPKVSSSNKSARYIFALRYATTELLHLQEELAKTRRELLTHQTREDALREAVEEALRQPPGRLAGTESGEARGQDRADDVTGYPASNEDKPGIPKDYINNNLCGVYRYSPLGKSVRNIVWVDLRCSNVRVEPQGFCKAHQVVFDSQLFRSKYFNEHIAESAPSESHIKCPNCGELMKYEHDGGRYGRVCYNCEYFEDA